MSKPSSLKHSSGDACMHACNDPHNVGVIEAMNVTYEDAIRKRKRKIYLSERE